MSLFVTGVAIISALVAFDEFVEPMNVREAGLISSLFNELLYLHIHSVQSDDKLL